MKRNNLIFTLLLAATMVGCDKESGKETINPNIPTKKIIATIQDQISGGETDTYTPSWHQGDAFGLFDGKKICNYTNPSNTTQEATFTTDSQVEYNDSYYAFAPEANLIEADSTAFKIAIPNQQEYISNNIQDYTLPMVGKWDGSKMVFQNTAAILALKLCVSQILEGTEIESITITGEKPLAGSATILHNSTEIQIDNGDSKSITLKTSNLTLSSTDTTNCFIILTPGTYNNLQITLNTQGGNQDLFTIEGETTLTRSTITTIVISDNNFAAAEESKLKELLQKQIADNRLPYIASIVDIDFAPGQFINTLPEGMTTKEKAIELSASSIAGVESNSGMVALGGWGGSITVGFDHPILNLKGADFRGYGNGFGGSSEPGVYYVAQKGADGKPAKWYLIKHSMYDYAIHDYEITYYKPKAESVTVYEAFYWKGDYSSTMTAVTKANQKKLVEIPCKDTETDKWYLYNGNIYKDSGQGNAAIMKLNKANMVVVELPNSNAPETYTDGTAEYPLAYINVSESFVFEDYIYWEDNMGHNGYECKNATHSQSYWPEYAGESITLKGEYLPVNSFDTSGNGSHYENDSKWWGFPIATAGGEYADPLDQGKNIGTGAYGFIDTYPNTHSLSCIDIDWAIDENGNHVHLTHIDFIKVQSATHRQAGWLGEISTEVGGIEDLHLLGQEVNPDTSIKPDVNNIPHSGDPTQPESGLLYWSYKQVEKK